MAGGQEGRPEAGLWSPCGPQANLSGIFCLLFWTLWLPGWLEEPAGIFRLGVRDGPQGTRHHVSCLKCQGTTVWLEHLQLI